MYSPFIQRHTRHFSLLPTTSMTSNKYSLPSGSITCELFIPSRPTWIRLRWAFSYLFSSLQCNEFAYGSNRAIWPQHLDALLPLSGCCKTCSLLKIVGSDFRSSIGKIAVWITDGIISKVELSLNIYTVLNIKVVTFQAVFPTNNWNPLPECLVFCFRLVLQQDIAFRNCLIEVNPFQVTVFIHDQMLFTFFIKFTDAAGYILWSPIHIWPVPQHI
mmetsp:Transcript_1201/g.7877  ORF Transcript_1201/g.7877 Transcript_1201/m.7877 type:complete len:216 (-) Transcript_1201:849-1496(-)